MKLRTALKICNNLETHSSIQCSPYKYQCLVSAVAVLTARITELENEMLLCAEIIDEQTNLHAMAAIMRCLATSGEGV